jgi:predicted phage terminase large subunit-like protein
LSRLDDKRTGAIIIVMQRLHIDDLVGFVTGQSDEWEVLNLSAIAEVDEVIPISDTKVHRRRVGEALSPVREPLSVLEELRAVLGSDTFSAQYQQMPVPPGGAMIKRHWIKRYVELPPRERSLILQSWDTASKGGPGNDFSVCTTWFISRDRRWYLIDVWRKRVDYPELKAAVRTLASYHAAKRVLVEDAGAGISLVQELLGEVDNILAVKPDRDKITRMSVVSAKFESGLVFLPERAAWLVDFEAELFAFPGSRHDDQCDSVSQALSDGNYGFPMKISAEAIAASRIRRPWMRRFDGLYG